MSDRKLQLKKKPVRVLDSGRLETVKGGGDGGNHYGQLPTDSHDNPKLTAYRCIGISGS